MQCWELEVLEEQELMCNKECEMPEQITNYYYSFMYEDEFWTHLRIIDMRDMSIKWDKKISSNTWYNNFDFLQISKNIWWYSYEWSKHISTITINEDWSIWEEIWHVEREWEYKSPILKEYRPNEYEDKYVMVSYMWWEVYVDIVNIDDNWNIAKIWEEDEIYEWVEKQIEICEWETNNVRELRYMIWETYKAWCTNGEYREFTIQRLKNNSEEFKSLAKVKIWNAEPVCWNNIEEEWEECDEWKNNWWEYCDNECNLVVKCWDWIINQDFEQCDDGNDVEDYLCSNSCQLNSVWENIDYEYEFKFMNAEWIIFYPEDCYNIIGSWDYYSQFDLVWILDWEEISINYTWVNNWNLLNSYYLIDIDWEWWNEPEYRYCNMSYAWWWRTKILDSRKLFAKHFYTITPDVKYNSFLAKRLSAKYHRISPRYGHEGCGKNKNIWAEWIVASWIWGIQFNWKTDPFYTIITSKYRSKYTFKIWDREKIFNSGSYNNGICGSNPVYDVYVR